MKIAREEQKKTDTPFLKCKQKMNEKIWKQLVFSLNDFIEIIAG